ncbi:hypothetical protein CAPTEDRAFT_201175, partial [Capitella teleta]
MTDNTEEKKKFVRQPDSESKKRLRQRLNLPLSLELGKAPGFYAGLLVTGLVFVVSFVVWSSIAEFREVAAADGELKPLGSTRLIQHLEGGIVSEIYAAEGQIVQKGDVLISMQPTDAKSDLQQINARIANLNLQVERISSQIEKREPVFLPDRYLDTALINSQVDIFLAERTRHRNEQEALKARIDQRRTELRVVEKELVAQKAQLDLAKQEHDMHQVLRDKKLLPRSEFLETQRSYQQARSNVVSAE